jgi:hypothetical protein
VDTDAQLQQDLTVLNSLLTDAPPSQPSLEPGADRSFKLNAAPDKSQLQLNNQSSELQLNQFKIATATKLPSTDVDLTP